MTPRGGKEQTGRDPTPGRNTRQDGLEVKHSEEPQLPTIHCCQSRHLSHSSTAPGVWKGGQVGARRRKSTSSGRGCPAAQHDSAVVSNDQEQWHKPAVPRAQTSATCGVRPLELLRSPHRDGVKVPPDQGRVGIVGGSRPCSTRSPCRGTASQGSQHGTKSSPWIWAGEPGSLSMLAEPRSREGRSGTAVAAGVATAAAGPARTWGT